MNLKKYVQINHKLNSIGGVQYYINTIKNEFKIFTIDVNNYFDFIVLFFSGDLRNKKIISHSFKLSLILSFFKKHILVVHDNHDAIKKNYYLYYLLIIKKNIELVVFTNYDIRKWGKNNWNLINNSFYVPIKKFDKIYNHTEENYSLIYFGRISNSQKKCDEILEFIKKHNLPIMFIGPFGDVSDKKEYEKYYGGVVNNINQLIEKLNHKKLIGISFSDHEGMPISMFELISFGIPYISTNSADSINYFFTEHHVGKIIDKNDPKNIISNINYVNKNYHYFHNNCKKLNIYSQWKNSWKNLLFLD